MFFSGGDVDQVRGAAMGAAVTQGWEVQQAVGTSLILQRKLDAAAAESLAPGASRGPLPPLIEVRADFFPGSGGVLVQLGADVVTGRGTEKLTRMDYTASYRNELTHSLSMLQQSWHETGPRLANALPPITGFRDSTQTNPATFEADSENQATPDSGLEESSAMASIGHEPSPATHVAATPHVGEATPSPAATWALPAASAATATATAAARAGTLPSSAPAPVSTLPPAAGVASPAQRASSAPRSTNRPGPAPVFSINPNATPRVAVTPANPSLASMAPPANAASTNQKVTTLGKSSVVVANPPAKLASVTATSAANTNPKIPKTATPIAPKTTLPATRNITNTTGKEKAAPPIPTTPVPSSASKVTSASKGSAQADKVTAKTSANSSDSKAKSAGATQATKADPSVTKSTTTAKSNTSIQKEK